METFLAFLTYFIIFLWLYVGYRFVRYLERRFIDGKKLHFGHSLLIIALWPFVVAFIFCAYAYGYVVGYIKSFINSFHEHRNQNDEDFF